MKNTYKFLILLLFSGLMLQSCEDQHDNDVPNDLTVNNFIWKGLNLYYLWQADVPNLSDYRFGNQGQLNNFLYGYSDPKDLFQNLLNKPISQFPREEAIDRFSVIFSDYTQLEGILSGTTKNNGLEIGLYYKDDSHTTIVGVVRYVLPNSNAATKDVHRGDIFYGIDGQELNLTNYSTLLSSDTYTLNLADYNAGSFTPNGESVSLTKTVVSENPVYINTVINYGAHKIGYLMYNGFYSDYENDLNNAFASLKSQGITELVLDLRYNGGGSIETSTRLASMITGQFNGQVFAKEQWNDKIENFHNANDPATSYSLFSNTINTGAAISSLNLTKIYFITSAGTASASELLINGLKPYINVVQIGDVTVGKNVGSITLYDSPTFTKESISTKHRYAMQPLVLKIVNKNGFGDYTSGLAPDVALKENLGNLGVLGNPDEPLLNAAITRIVGGGRSIPQNRETHYDEFRPNQPIEQLKSEMYLENIPKGFIP